MISWIRVRLRTASARISPSHAITWRPGSTWRFLATCGHVHGHGRPHPPNRCGTAACACPQAQISQAQASKTTSTSQALAIAAGLVALAIAWQTLKPTLKLWAGKWVEETARVQAERLREERRYAADEAARRRTRATTQTGPSSVALLIEPRD